MILSDVIDILDAKILSDDFDPDHIVETCCGSDMMSDVLAFVKTNALLLTGLTNPQVMRTAEMLDIICVVFVRGKEPNADMLKLANMKGMYILKTDLTMFEACGKLYAEGLQGGQRIE